MNLETIRHSASHVLASAVKELFPNAKLGIGPSIEDGFYYDFDLKHNLIPEDLKKIEKKMQEIINKNLIFKKSKKTREQAKRILKNEPFKLELLKDLPNNNIIFYSLDSFIDLCAGPHVKSTKEIKAFKLLKIAGAYWKGDRKNKQLQRIYGTAFASKEELNIYLKRLEEAEKRNHVKLGKQLDLFSIHEEGPGFIFWHPKGVVIINELISFWRKVHEKENYKEIKTPIILSKKLWEESGHWDHYKENMYFTKVDNRDFAVKPMNCPGAVLIYKEGLHSYKEFPLRLAELGLVHRHELSGVLNGLLRLRSFTQDDAHIFLEESQIKEEVIRIIDLIDYFYKKVFKFNYYIELSTKPKKAMGSKTTWDKAEKALKEALDNKKINYKINKGEGAFYGPKIDFHVEDSLGRTWQLATIQLDFSFPERFDLTYEGKDGKKHRPVMIHRVVYGAIERFLGILIEHYAGKFPLWLSPIQVKILTLTDRNKEFALEVYNNLKYNNIRVELDDRSESIGKKVRDSQLEKINYSITIGDKEQENNTLAIRTLDGKVQFGVKLDQFINNILDEIKEKR